LDAEWLGKIAPAVRFDRIGATPGDGAPAAKRSVPSPAVLALPKLCD